MESNQSYGAWNGADIEQFLLNSRAPMRVALQTRKGLLIVPLWFSYREDCLWSCSPRSSTLAKSLADHPEVAFDISTNEIPYKGVRGRALAHCLAPNGTVELEELVERYLTDSDNQLARWLLSRADNELLIRWDITWLTSWDFSRRMGDVKKISDRDGQAPI